MGYYEDTVNFISSMENLAKIDELITKKKMKIDTRVEVVYLIPIGDDGRLGSSTSPFSLASKTNFSRAIDELFPMILERAKAIATKAYQESKKNFEEEHRKKLAGVDDMYSKVSKLLDNDANQTGG